MGLGGRRGPFSSAERTQPGGHHHLFNTNSSLLLPVLVDSDPGPGQPTVWTSAKERDHMVSALLLGVNTRPWCYVGNMSRVIPSLLD